MYAYTYVSTYMYTHSAYAYAYAPQAIEGWWEGLESTYYWWEAAEMFRRYLLVGQFMTVMRGTILQLILATIFSAAYLTIQLTLKPYSDRWDNFVACSSSAALVAVFASCIAFKFGSLIDTPDLHQMLSQEQRQVFAHSSLLLSVLIFGGMSSTLVICTLLFLFQVATPEKASEGGMQHAAGRPAESRVSSTGGVGPGTQQTRGVTFKESQREQCAKESKLGSGRFVSARKFFTDKSHRHLDDELSTKSMRERAPSQRGQRTLPVKATPASATAPLAAESGSGSTCHEFEKHSRETKMRRGSAQFATCVEDPRGVLRKCSFEKSHKNLIDECAQLSSRERAPSQRRGTACCPRGTHSLAGSQDGAEKAWQATDTHVNTPVVSRNSTPSSTKKSGGQQQWIHAKRDLCSSRRLPPPAWFGSGPHVQAAETGQHYVSGSLESIRECSSEGQRVLGVPLSNKTGANRVLHCQSRHVYI